MDIPFFKELHVEPLTKAFIILDIDGTLVHDAESGVEAATEAVIKQLITQGNSIYLVSNGFSNKRERNRKIAKGLGVTFYESKAKKPFAAAVAELLQKNNAPVVVIGDKFLTDGLLAINIRAPFIRVRSRRASSDSLYSKAAYAADQLASRLFGGLARPPHYLAALYGRPLNLSITVLTRPPASWMNFWEVAVEPLKIGLKRILFGLTRKPRYITTTGPYGVIRSLLAGFDELRAPYLFNPWQHCVSPTVCVIRGTETLRWAIDQKRRGFIKTIIAGPNIVVTPQDENRLIMDLAIDRIVVPSPWNKDWWVSFDQSLERRIWPWAAGVSDHGVGRTPKSVCLVYSKNTDERLFNKIIESLWTHKLPIAVSSYGQFHQHEYFRLLKQARMMVYLSDFESQGLALHEAWMADIPTLILNKGSLEYQEYRWSDPLIGAPYFDPQCGLLFSNAEDFESKLIEFLEKYETFTPRRYSLAHFTNAITARKYLDIVEGAQKNA